MSFNYRYVVQFRDTDAAGVVYFAEILSLCHVAYEASLIAAGISLQSLVATPNFAIPIVQTSANFFQPLRWGDAIDIALTPTPLSDRKFEINYRLTMVETDMLAATATTTHIAIDPLTRQKQTLSPDFLNWLKIWGKS
jgi:1,4-dihydroxy-2-naphthoyl-CoA hydrolase